MPNEIPSPAEIEQAVYAERQRRFSDRSKRGWDQALEAEVADLILRRLRGENINTGLDARVKAALVVEGRKGMIVTGNGPESRISVGGREVLGDGIVWPDSRPASSVDGYIYLATADEQRREHGLYETSRLTVQELAADLGVPADETNLGRVRTVLYRLRDGSDVTRDDDDCWRAADQRIAGVTGSLHAPVVGRQPDRRMMPMSASEEGLLPYLRTLGGQDTWRLNNLPSSITESVLRALDGRAWIEVRLWKQGRNVVSDEWVPGGPEPLTCWFSPQRDHGKVATVGEDQWPTLLNPRRYSAELSPELRLTPAGKAALAELTLHVPSSVTAGPAATEVSETPATQVDDGKLIDDVVTLSQAAALAGVSKRTLERHLATNAVPEPDVPGGDGRAHKWLWRNLRPALAKIARRQLPERFPASRII